MAISFACECGKRFKAKDEQAGEAFECPLCGASLSVPVWIPKPPAKVEVKVEAETESRSRRPFWKDPVILIGAAVPTLILAIFFGYLWNERADRLMVEQVHAKKAEADQFMIEGNQEAALDCYDSLLSLVTHEPSDAQTKAEVEAARRARDKLVPVVAALHAKREKLAKEAEEAIAKAQRLRQVKAWVVGLAYVNFKSQSYTKLRGIDIYLLKPVVPKREVAQVLARVEWLATFTRGFAESKIKDARQIQALIEKEEAAKRLAALPDETLLDTEDVYRIIRLTALGSRREQVVEDALWPKVIALTTLSQAETDIEGKYLLDDVQGGSYYVYAVYETPLSVIEWLFKLDIEKDGEHKLDLHNNKAMLIINEKDSS